MNVIKQALIFGATGNVGGASARELLKREWQVRAVTRNPNSEKAQALASLGAQVVQADMEDSTSLNNAFGGITKVLSVQNWYLSGSEGEIRQGKLVADAAKAANVDHLVYISAGDGQENSEVPHFDSKVEVQGYMQRLELPFTVIRPAPFMELLTENEFFPQLSAWGAMTTIIDRDIKLPWVSVHDIGLSIANIFENPDQWIGKEIDLLGDVKSMRDCEKVFSKVNGKKPTRIALPLWFFSKIAKKELIKMWQWIDQFSTTQGEQNLWKYVEKTKQVNPNLLDLESWLQQKRSGAIS